MIWDLLAFAGISLFVLGLGLIYLPLAALGAGLAFQVVGLMGAKRWHS